MLTELATIEAGNIPIGSLLTDAHAVTAMTVLGAHLNFSDLGGLGDTTQ